MAGDECPKNATSLVAALGLKSAVKPYTRKAKGRPKAVAQFAVPSTSRGRMREHLALLRAPLVVYANENFVLMICAFARGAIVV